MKVLLLQLDGKIPNVALMRVAAHHRGLGDEVELRHGVMQGLLDQPDKIYASLIFSKTKWKAVQLLRERPDAVVGGTGWDLSTTLEGIGIERLDQDYSVYPRWRQSIGFTQRGCTLSCSFCVVPEKEGKARPVATIAEIWRGDPWPRELLLLDNDFFARANPWRERIAEIRDGDFKVSFNQGINARFLNRESATAIASVNYRDDSMKVKRIYTAWDNRKDEATLFRGLQSLVDAGVKPRHIMVYMLIAYWPGEAVLDWQYRQAKLRAFGCLPYPMPFVRNKVTLGFQRWVLGGYDKSIPWKEWERANYQPRRLQRFGPASTFLSEI